MEQNKKRIFWRAGILSS